jgi:hypothetical protein
MSLKTRLDGRSEDNASFKIKDADGCVLAEIRLMDSTSATLEVNTIEPLYIEKVNGWNSKG